MLPANQARSDLNNIRGQTGTVGKFGTFASKALGMKPVGAATAPGGVTPVPGLVAKRMQVPTGKPADANPSMVNPGLSPATPAPLPAAPTPVAGVPPMAPQTTAGAPTPISTFGPGNDLLSSQINPGNSGVNRTQLAQNQLNAYDAQDAPRMANEMRLVGQNAAKFGRIGAGMTTNDLTGIEATHARDRGSLAASLASGLADSTVNDAANNNAQMRTERDYQTGRSDKAQQDQINQQILQDQLLNSRFGRAKTLTDTGYANDPTSLLYGTSQDAGNQSANAISGGIDLLKSRQPVQQSPDYTELLKQLLAQQSGTH